MCFSLLAVPVSAAPPFGVFKDISDMDEKIAKRMMALEFDGVLSVLDPSGRSLSAEQRSKFVGSLTNYFRTPLTQKAVLREELMGGGFRRALYGYWENDLPIYLYVVTHTRADGVWLLHYDLQTTFSTAVSNFR
jgi:hypothetical protein